MASLGYSSRYRPIMSLPTRNSTTAAHTARAVIRMRCSTSMRRQPRRLCQRSTLEQSTSLTAEGSPKSNLALGPAARSSRRCGEIERQRFDHSKLEAAMAYADQVTRETRRALDGLIRTAPASREDATDPVLIQDKAVASTNIRGFVGPTG